MATNGALRALLENAIDYAGLFPPAALDLPTVARRFAEYRAGDDAWALGRLVVPASRLGELSGIASPLLARQQPEEGLAATPWHISALVGEDAETDLALVAGFNDRHRRDSEHGHAVVDVVELRVAEVEAIPAALQQLPEWLHTFVEIPAAADARRAAALLREHGAAAKLRTGGITAGAFPAAEVVAGFLYACADAGIACKLTAGLHHAVGGDYPLTYEADSVRGAMFGFVPVLLAAALARRGATVAEIAALLVEHDASSFTVRPASIAWDGHEISAADAEASRTMLVASFGSCSFEEPLHELRTLGWL